MINIITIILSSSSLVINARKGAVESSVNQHGGDSGAIAAEKQGLRERGRGDDADDEGDDHDGDCIHSSIDA